MDKLSVSRPQNRLSARQMVAVLAGVVGTLLILLHWFGTSAAPVHREQFAQLLGEELVSSVSIGMDGLEAHLVTPVRLESRGTRMVTDHVHVALESRPSESEIQDWQMRGVRVTFQTVADQRRRNAGGLAVVGILLGIGVWHLWMEIHEDRHGAGSPRRRLRDLDAALAKGGISQEEYTTRAREIWAEM